MSAIKTFISRVIESEKTGSKDFRMKITDARELANELAAISVENNQLSKKVIALQEQIIKKQQTPVQDTVSVIADGGTF